MTKSNNKIKKLIVEHIDVIYYGGCGDGKKSLEASFEVIDNDIVLQEGINELFGVSYETVKALVLGCNGSPPAINRDLLDSSLGLKL